MCRGIHKISRSAQPLLDSLSPAGATKVLLILWRMARDHVAMIPRVRIIGPYRKPRSLSSLGFWALFPSLAPIAWRAIASGATDWSGDVLLDALGAHPAVIYAVVTSFFVCYLQCFLAGLFAAPRLYAFQHIPKISVSSKRKRSNIIYLQPPKCCFFGSFKKNCLLSETPQKSALERFLAAGCFSVFSSVSLRPLFG